MTECIRCTRRRCIQGNCKNPVSYTHLEEARAICLLDCTQTPRDANGDYLATVEDSGIVNAKLMIWDG